MDDYVTVTKLTDPVVSSIPTAEAREVMPPTAQRIVCKNIGEAFGEMIRRDLREGILRDLFGAHWEKKRNLAVSAENPFRAPEEFADPNAAMIARDEADWGRLAVRSFDLADAPCLVEGPFTYSRDLCEVVWASDDGITFSRLERKPGVKPATTGLTTVHGGKERGLGFCCDA